MAITIPSAVMERYLALDDKQKLKFDAQFQSEAKDPTIALICALFGVYYFYMGNIGLAIANILSSLVCVGVFWSIALLVGSKKNVEKHNLDVAQKILISM
jgi:hypothetical protein